MECLHLWMMPHHAFGGVQWMAAMCCCILVKSGTADAIRQMMESYISPIRWPRLPIFECWLANIGIPRWASESWTFKISKGWDSPWTLYFFQCFSWSSVSAKTFPLLYPTISTRSRFWIGASDWIEAEQSASEFDGGKSPRRHQSVCFYAGASLLG